MTLPDEMLSIETPENVAFGYSVAGIGSRFLAALIDTAVIVMLELTVVFASSFVMTVSEVTSSLGVWATAILGLISFAIFWGYYIFFEMLWNGQSLGKRLVGLRVIRLDGTPVTLAESVIRNLVRLIDFLPFGYGIGVVTMFINSQARRLGDLAAGSLVVHDGGEVSVQSIAARQTIPLLNVLAEQVVLDPNLPLERIEQQDIQILEDFLTRRHQLSNAQLLAAQILKRLYTKMGVEITQNPAPPDRQLAALLVAIRNRHHPENVGNQNGEKR